MEDDTFIKYHLYQFLNRAMKTAPDFLPWFFILCLLINLCIWKGFFISSQFDLLFHFFEWSFEILNWSSVLFCRSPSLVISHTASKITFVITWATDWTNAYWENKTGYTEWSYRKQWRIIVWWWSQWTSSESPTHCNRSDRRMAPLPFGYALQFKCSPPQNRHELVLWR